MAEILEILNMFSVILRESNLKLYEFFKNIDLSVFMLALLQRMSQRTVGTAR